MVNSNLPIVQSIVIGSFEFTCNNNDVHYRLKTNKEYPYSKTICFDLIVGVLTPLSAIFQLYYDDQF